MLEQPRLTDEQKAEAVARWQAGETYESLARCFGVSQTSIVNYVKRSGVKRNPKPKKIPATSVAEFTKRCRKILWRSNRKDYEAWETKWMGLMDKSGYTKDQAVVQASKEFPKLQQLYMEYELKEFDPNPESHPEIRHCGDPMSLDGIELEGRDLSFRGNLNWAITAAGEYLRTSKLPVSTPNDAAFYLFKQACEAPKDFLQKFTQVEVKVDDESLACKRSKESGKKTIAELNEMLDTLTEEREDEED